MKGFAFQIVLKKFDKPKIVILGLMNLFKINFWLVGATLVFAGLLVIYNESYRDNKMIDLVAYIVIFAGWLVLFTKATLNTSIGHTNILFNKDKVGWFKQRLLNSLCYVTLGIAVCGSIFLADILANNREKKILDDQQTKITIARVDHIVVQNTRKRDYYYAVFECDANGKLTSYTVRMDRPSTYLVGDKYQIKYSVRYPEIFRLMGKVEPPATP